jgi:hypothetical protein
MKKLLSSLVATLAFAGTAWAQIGAPVQAGGVEVDSDRVLKSQSTSSDPRLAELWKKASSLKSDEQLLYISLPKLFDEARKCQADGKPLPDAIRFLGGMVRLQYVFVYPDEKDIVIAGPAEPFDTDSFRPLGKITGRPVLQLDDLVIALRACGPGKAGAVVGCDLQVTQEIADRIQKKTAEVAPKIGTLGEKKAAEMIADAGGNQPVRYMGLELNSRYAFVCIEADYRLKQLGLGILPSPIKKVKSYNSLAGKPEQPHRFTLVSNLQHLAGTPDGNAFELLGNSLKAECSLVSGDDKVSDAAKQFVALCNANLDDLCKHMLSWADLSNLADLAVLAALIGEEGLQKKVGWELGWFLDPKGYAATPITTPTSAKTLTTFRSTNGMTIFVSGGVALDPLGQVKGRAKDEKETAKTMAQRPQGTDGWSSTKKVEKTEKK